MFNLKVIVQPEHNPLSYLNQTRFLATSTLVCQHLIEFSSASLESVRIFLTRQRHSTQTGSNCGNFNPIMRWQQATSDLKASW